MQYIAILGRQPELGRVELESILGPTHIAPFGNEAALIDHKLDINRLGGTQKLARLIYRGASRDLNEAPLNLNELPLREGKTTFGLSFYGIKATSRFVQAAGLTLKKRLKSKGSVRLVSPQTGTHLSAAQVKFNGLVRSGFELLVVSNGTEMLIGITEQIQDIDWYATRDYNRPTRSAKVGMLPPKLAQIMVNSTSCPLVCDPFCGTGVLLQEALLLGLAASGSDISNEMVAATKQNLTWLRTQRTGLPDWSVVAADARKVKLPHGPLAIVSEGYLGPNQTKRTNPQAIKPVQRDLLELYRASLSNWATQLAPGSELTITTPVWNTVNGWEGLGLVDRLSDLGYTLKSFVHANAHTLVYRRPNQFVGRQLIIARKS